MKTLFLLRHAPALPAKEGGLDRGRMLSPEGEKQAQYLATKLVRSKLKIDLMLTSPASRSLETAAILLEVGAGGKRCVLKIDNRLYSSDADGLFSVVEDVKKSIDTLVLIGHNPSISVLAKRFSDQIHSLPPCGLVGFQFKMKTWSKLCKADILKVAVRFPNTEAGHQATDVKQD